jgi:hypothetical protein
MADVKRNASLTTKWPNEFALTGEDTDTCIPHTTQLFEVSERHFHSDLPKPPSDEGFGTC